MVKWRPRLHIFVVRNSVMTIKRITSPFSCVIYQLTQPQVANQQKRKKKFLEHSNLEMPSLMYNLSLAHQSNLREKIYQISHIFKNSIENKVNFDDGWFGFQNLQLSHQKSFIGQILEFELWGCDSPASFTLTRYVGQPLAFFHHPKNYMYRQSPIFSLVTKKHNLANFMQILIFSIFLRHPVTIFTATAP